MASVSSVPDSSRTRNAPVAQWTERRPSKPLVTGSNPVGGAKTGINRFKVACMVGARTLADPATAQTQTITYDKCHWFSRLKSPRRVVILAIGTIGHSCGNRFLYDHRVCIILPINHGDESWAKDRVDLTSMPWSS